MHSSSVSDVQYSCFLCCTKFLFSVLYKIPVFIDVQYSCFLWCTLQQLPVINCRFCLRKIVRIRGLCDYPTIKFTYGLQRRGKNLDNLKIKICQFLSDPKWDDWNICNWSLESLEGHRQLKGQQNLQIKAVNEEN